MFLYINYEIKEIIWMVFMDDIELNPGYFSVFGSSPVCYLNMFD